VQGSHTYEVRYSLFDLKQNNGTGGMVKFNQLLFTKSTERITSNGNWLVAHEYGNNSFRAYRITQDGIGQPVISAIGSDHTFAVAEQGQGYMEFGGNNKLIVALSTPGVSNRLETFDFADSTGTVTNFQPVDLKSPAGQVYGIEYSGGKVFASIKEATTSKIVEVFFDTLGIPRTVRQTPPITVNGEVGAIQTGPDGTIYVAVNGKAALGTIQPQADTLRVSTYTPDAFALAGGTNSMLGLPNFIQVIADPLQTPGITVAGQCEDDSVSFSATPTDPIDKFLWQIRTASGTVVTTSTEQTFNYLFPDPGDYVATLQLTNRCGLNKTFTQNFKIRAKPAPPTNPAQVILCTTTTIQLEAQPANDPNLTYSWSTGENTRVITINGIGQYTATLTNVFGCSSSTTTSVFDNRPIVDLGPDQTLCEDVAVPDLNAGNPTAASYTWTIAANGGAPAPATPGNGQLQQVNSTTAGVFKYTVLVKAVDPDGAGPLPQCEATDSKVFTFNKTPDYTLTPTDVTGLCTNANGSIRIDFSNAPPNVNTQFGFTISGPTTPTPASGSNQAPGSFVTTNPTLSAGSYGVTVTDQVTGCAIQKVTAINNAGAFTITGTTQTSNCNPVTIDVTHSLGGASYTYNVYDPGNTSVASGGGTSSPFTVSIPNAQTATYNITMVSGGCTITQPVAVTAGAPLRVVLTPNVCSSPITITAASSDDPSPAIWAWSSVDPFANISGGQATPTVSATPPVGSAPTYNVQVTPSAAATAAGFCPSTTSIQVNIPAPLTADFTASNSCAAQVTLTPVPASNAFRYQWYQGSSSSGTLISTSQSLITTTGGQFTVVITDPTTGCFKESLPKPVSVNGAVSVTLASTLACDNAPFTLTATPTPTSATFKWFYNNSEIAGQVASTLQDTRAGTYQVEAKVGPCPATASMTVILAPSTAGLLPETVVLCPEDANPDPATRRVVLDPGEFDSYDWFKDGVTLGVTDRTVTVETAEQVGLYTVNLINAFQCASSDKTRIVVDCEPRIVAPTAFRPGSMEGNGFGLENGAFGVMTFFISDDDFSIFIFNRWGEMVYQSDSREFRWNGAFNNAGTLLPAGTYSYVIRYKSNYRLEEGVKEKRGGVVLVR